MFCLFSGFFFFLLCICVFFIFDVLLFWVLKKNTAFTAFEARGPSQTPILGIGLCKRKKYYLVCRMGWGGFLLLQYAPTDYLVVKRKPL